MDYSIHVSAQNIAESIYDNEFSFIFRVFESHFYPYDDNNFSLERVKTTEFLHPLNSIVHPWPSLRSSVSDMLSRLEPFHQHPSILLVPLNQETRIYLSDDVNDQPALYSDVVAKICETARAVEVDRPSLGTVVMIEKRVVMSVGREAYELERQVLMESFLEEEQVVRAAPAERSAVEGLETRHVSDEEFCCMICLENVCAGSRVELKIMPCSHMFHSHCIVSWLSQNHTCPLCRFKLPQCVCDK